MILLDEKEKQAALRDTHIDYFVDMAAKKIVDNVVKATGKKILIELQRIYNLPDEGMFHEQMGEFIEQLSKEVK